MTELGRLEPRGPKAMGLNMAQNTGSKAWYCEVCYISEDQPRLDNLNVNLHDVPNRVFS